MDYLLKNYGKYLMQHGCKIYTNKLVNNIKKEQNKWILSTDDFTDSFDIVVCTTAYPITQKIFNKYLNNDEIIKMNLVEYTSAKTLILVSKKSISDFYWINIGDNSMPFGGIIEHTNMIKEETYNNKKIIYISNYMFKNDKLYNLSANQLLKEYMPFLNKINKNFSINDIEEAISYEEEFAQPVIKKNYSKIMLQPKLNAKGLYIAGMAQIYPEDRGMNYAIKLGIDVANNIIKNN